MARFLFSLSLFHLVIFNSNGAFSLFHNFLVYFSSAFETGVQFYILYRRIEIVEIGIRRLNFGLRVIYMDE